MTRHNIDRLNYEYIDKQNYEYIDKQNYKIKNIVKQINFYML